MWRTASDRWRRRASTTHVVTVRTLISVLSVFSLGLGSCTSELDDGGDGGDSGGSAGATSGAGGSSPSGGSPSGGTAGSPAGTGGSMAGDAGASETGGSSNGATSPAQLAELEIAEPYVTFAVNRASCDQGQPAQVPCTITHNTPFEGSAQAQLLGLPPGVAVAPVEFTKDTAELVFQVTTAKETPVGSHKTLFCQVNITQNGEPIVGTVGTTELQVNAPPAAAAAATPPAEAAPAAAKPLSRLQQLRAKVLKPEAAKP